ncbi:MAG: hypothetical protein L0206_26010 [Actinobacteria bacterium]|nr:hypothetical protein [Actinomycetota bacterium]
MIRVMCIGVILVATASGIGAQSFNIDVGELGSEPPATYAGAGLAGVWNSVRADHVTPFTTGPTPQDVMLVDIAGNPTGVGFHQYGGQDHVTTNDVSVTGNDAVLLNDYLATHSLTLESCMYLNGLANGTYEVITYAWMPNSPATLQLVRFDFHPGSTLVGGSWTGAHVEGVTYSRDLIDVTDGHIGFHVGIPNGFPTFPGAAFNGFQLRKIEAAPVPLLPPWALAALVLAVAGGGSLLIARRRAA